MKKSDYLHIRIDPALKKKAEAAAKRDHRSLAATVEMLLTRYVEDSEREAKRK